MPPGHVKHIWQLDALRGAAASYVVLYHSRFIRQHGGGIVFSFGPEAVTLFFVLSGFVISFATEGRHLAIGAYFKRRFKRIYPIFVLALIYSYVIACLNQRQLVPIQLRWLLGNLAMLQDLPGVKRGTIFGPYQSNAPLWSLSYEWWFYLLFAAASCWSPTGRRSQAMIVLLISLLATLVDQIFPHFVWLVLGYWFTWWCGVELCREFRQTGTVSFRGQRLSLLGIAALLCIWATQAVTRRIHHQPLEMEYEPILQLRHIGMAGLIIVLVLVYAAKPARWVSTALKPFGWIGGISYALYVFHEPALNSSNVWVKIIGLLCLLPLCVFAERFYQPWANGVIDRGIAACVSRKHTLPAT